MQELRTPLVGFKWLTNWPGVALAPRGDGRSVMLLPGYMAGEKYMYPMKSYLSFLGYRAMDWGQGVNKGNVFRYTEQVILSLEKHAEDFGQPTSLVGWSLGGVIARNVTRERPDLVRETITFGTPIIGGPKYTAAGARYATKEKLDLDAFEEHVHDLNAEGLDRPCTSIFSKTDGIVPWLSSQDPYNDHTNHIEVPGTHLGMGYNPHVWKAVAKSLAANKD